MDRFGVDLQVLSVSIPQAYHADRATAVAMAQAANDGTAEACRRHPTRFKGFASLPLPHVAAALDELARAVDRLGLHGVVLGGNVLLEPLDSPEFAPLFHEINRRNLALFIHPMVPCGVEGMREYDLAAAVGYMLDTCLAALRLVYSGTCERCPNLRPILCHAGGYLPFQWDRLDTSYTTRPEARERISLPPTEYLKRFYYDNANFHVPALRCTVDTVGASQLVLGSDYPFGLGDMARMVSSYEALGLSPEDRARVESGTALSLLR
jgi:aminocarboxymuconate-semialdehyde decarboxylase